MTLLWREATPPAGLSDDEAHVWAVRVDETQAPADQRMACFSPDERQRAEQFQLEAPRRRFIVARTALRRLLGHYLDIPAADISLAYSPRGKPMLGGTSAGGSLQFNVAHTHELALVAVTRGCDVGVDVERLRMVSRLESIVRRYFHPAEVSEILKAPAESRNEAFLRCWTAKEAVIKAIGTGITDSLAAFCVSVANSNGAWVEMPIFDNATPLRCWLQRLSPSESSTAAVAFVGEQRRVRCFTLSCDEA
ncbi:MAG TPA: 4'-phosphopantetheinyl transferase superfamily protein [Lacipirellulaceae bacterium]|jgi:4'-phosphopantetheinyl transferase|nr:4'-phosphopantetheinyl transferase superfamily protein [Lacipirellulaceae bacterium]